MARILYIEDDESSRVLVRRVLGKFGHTIDEARDGLEGVALAREGAPDLVLVDLDIPTLDGFEVTLRLRSEGALARVPIVAITAGGDRERSLAIGCDGFIRKPIDVKSFPQTIGAYLDGAKENSGELRETLFREQTLSIVRHLEERLAELSRANARLRDLSSARTEFYRNVSHELATPMTPIVGYIKLLRDGELGSLNEAQQKAVDAMGSSVTRLRGTIDNLLDVTGLETGQMRFVHRPYDVVHSIRRVLDAVKERATVAGVEIAVFGLEGEVRAEGDALRVEQATRHLLENAIKFGAGKPVGLSLTAGTDSFSISVADMGPGIEAGKQPRIFEPFYQVDGSQTRRHGGMGVGLAIAERTARTLGGGILLTSPCAFEVGALTFTGSLFTMTIQRLSQHRPST